LWFARALGAPKICYFLITFELRAQPIHPFCYPVPEAGCIGSGITEAKLNANHRKAKKIIKD
jgi:hypothetical protein